MLIFRDILSSFCVFQYGGTRHRQSSIVFLESYDFSEKKIVLFVTSGGSGFGKTLANLKDRLHGNADIMEGQMLNGDLSNSTLSTWKNPFS